MKKYSSGSFIDAAVRVYGSEADILTSFPASIIANGGNITPWAVYGNTVEGVGVGAKTDNLFNYRTMAGTIKGYYLSSTGTLEASSTAAVTDYIPCDGGVFTLGKVGGVSPSICLYDENKQFLYGQAYNTTGGTDKQNIIVDTNVDAKFIRFTYFYAGTADDLSKIMLNKGDTARPYQPYGYNVIISCGDTDYNCYIADVLRKSSGADPVYDIMSSTGVITRNVDTDGTPLVTPKTESFIAPTLATVAGSQSVSFDTTVKPSKAELTYTGWHTHTDKKYSGGSWGTVTINAKKKKSLLGSRKTTKGKT